MAGKIKVKEHEKLDDANIERVIAVFEAEKPCTITYACEMLNISSNGARLKKIIQDYKDRKELDKQRRAANRGKPASEYETSTIVEDYLGGDSIKSIADRLYRSADFVKRIIASVGVPQVQSGEDYFKFEPLPEQCMADSFTVGDYVWSSRYGAIAEVTAEAGLSKEGVNLYQIYVHQRIDPEKSLVDGKHHYAHHVTTGGGYYAYQCAYDLGSLKHLAQAGVNVRKAIK